MLALELDSGDPNRGVCDPQEPGPDATRNKIPMMRMSPNVIELSQRDTKPIPMVLRNER